MPDLRSHTRWLVFVSIVLFTSACRDAIAPRTDNVGRVAPLASLVTLSSAKTVTLTYICGNRFRVRNPLSNTVLVHWDVHHTSDSGTLTLAPRPSNGLYSETFFTTHATGTTRLFFEGTLIQTAKNGSKGDDGEGGDDKHSDSNGDHGNGDNSTACPGNLVIVVGAGVLGLQSGSTPYMNGTTVSYSAQPAAGYTSVRIFLDTLEVPATGILTIAGAKTLVAFALADNATRPTDPGLIQRFRSLLSSNTQVADYQSLIYAAAALADQVGPERADSITRASADAAFSFPRDSAALTQLDQHLAGHSFDAESLPPVESALPFGPNATLPYGFPSNATVIPPLGASRMAPLSGGAQLRTPGSRVSVTITPTPRSANPRPVIVVHVNGVNTSLDEFPANVRTLRFAVREQPLLTDPRHARVTGIYNPNIGFFFHCTSKHAMRTRSQSTSGRNPAIVASTDIQSRLHSSRITADRNCRRR